MRSRWPTPGSFMWGVSHVPFTWYVMIGSLITFTIGYAASALFQQNSGDFELAD